jgi:hypothetical protein
LTKSKFGQIELSPQPSFSISPKVGQNILSLHYSQFNQPKKGPKQLIIAAHFFRPNPKFAKVAYCYNPVLLLSPKCGQNSLSLQPSSLNQPKTLPKQQIIAIQFFQSAKMAK